MERRAYKIKAGSIKRLKHSAETLIAPQKGEVQVAIKAIGLNFADVFAILGLYSATPKGEFVPGLEYAGEIIAVGEGCTDVAVGDRVMGVTRFGAYTTHLNIDQRYVIPIPSDWSYDQGASYLVQVLTAYYGLINLGGLKADQNVLIHSAAGGVGIWANRICQKMGAKTIGTVGRTTKIDLLKEEGYEKWIVRNEKTFTSDLTKALGGEELHMIMECIGGKILKEGYKQLAPMGRHIVYGSAHYTDTSSTPNYLRLIPKYIMRPRIDPQNMIEENKSVMAFNLIYLFDNVNLMHEILSELRGLDLGAPIVGHTFSFDQLRDAIELFQTGSTTGKVVVTV